MSKATTTKIAWHKSKIIPGRLGANNGLDLLDNPAYISAAIMPHYSESVGRYEGFMLVFWTGRSHTSTVKREWYKLQGEAKAVGLEVLRKSLLAFDDDKPYDLSGWLLCDFHDIHMATLYPEDYTYPRTPRS